MSYNGEEGRPPVRVGVAVAHLGHVLAVRGVLFIAYKDELTNRNSGEGDEESDTFCKDYIFVEGGSEFETFGRFLPGIVID